MGNEQIIWKNLLQIYFTEANSGVSRGLEF